MVSLIFYWVTVDPGISYWDCPEYATVASFMEVGHPPGNPIWMLVMRVATIPFPLELHPLVINLCSGLFMAFAAFFLCRVIFVPVALFFLRHRASFKAKYKNLQNLCYSLAGIVAAGASLCFSLCDSAWFSAVEAEVYALSTFLSALSLWILTLWCLANSQGRKIKLIILLAYISGISLGVHQLNLLLIPLFTLVIFYHNHPRKVNPGIPLLIFIISVAGVGLILWAFMPGLLFGAQAFELWSVNALNMPYHSGIIIFCSLLFILFLILVTGLSNAPIHAGNLKRLTLIRRSYIGIWMVGFLILGFSSFGIILIRGIAAPPMNQGNVDNIFALASYINRDQYPSNPLFYGATPYSRPLFKETFQDSTPRYVYYLLEKRKGNYAPFIYEGVLNHRSGMLSREDSSKNDAIIKKGKGYILTDYNFRQKTTPELNMWFPRITSRRQADKLAYMDWADMSEENMLYIPVSETVDSIGNFQPKLDDKGLRTPVYSYRPTYWQNLRFFISYQSYYMFFRYLFWNFIGRQNDYHSMGEIEHGNFLTGINWIDSSLLGSTDKTPSEIGEENPGRNRYFGLPFLIGLIGIFWLLIAGRKERRYLSLILCIFVMTGLAIVAYLNQSPGEPRERDYTFLVSYMAFIMWIAAGFVALTRVFAKYFHAKLLIAIISLISFGLPALMASENFDDHDRRNRFEPAFFASTYLDFEIPSIIFSYGDNSSFPLWFLSEQRYNRDFKSQENYSQYHIPVDISYLSLPGYVENLKKQGERGIKTLAPTSQIAYGALLITHIPHDSVSAPLPLSDALRKFYSGVNLNGSLAGNPEFPSSKIIITSSQTDSLVISLRDLTGGSSFLTFKQLMQLDILATQLESLNPKALYYPYLLEHSFYKGLSSALTPTAFGYLYAPWLSEEDLSLILKNSVERELLKLETVNKENHYRDPIIADRISRYRSELIIAAKQLLDTGYPELSFQIVDRIMEIFPYEKIYPGTITLGDTTFYEGKEMSKLLGNLLDFIDSPMRDSLYSERSANESIIGNRAAGAGDDDRFEIYSLRKNRIDSLMESRRKEWMRYYHSLSPSQRKSISNRSKHILSPRYH